MPEISSLLSDFSSLAIHAPDEPDVAPAGAGSGQEQPMPACPNASSFFRLAAQFDVPSHSVSADGMLDSFMQSSPKFSNSILGIGASCAVKLHRTGSEEASTCPTGTLVALKRYHPSPEGQETATTTKTHTLLWRELNALCHPRLRSHENIYSLVFLGWEDTSLHPVLALEFATHGSLEECLQDIRSYSPPLRKAHLSLDIAAGLAAIHQCGLVHGDIKPANIMVYDHPSRLIVAKISDLNGVAPVASYGSSRYTMTTPTWQAPEIAYFPKEIVDHQLTDVYSFGMVLATMWTAIGWIPPGGCLLDIGIPFSLSKPDRERAIHITKLFPDGHEAGMVNIALKVTRAMSIELLPLADIIRRTLATSPLERLPMQSILSSYFLGFSQAHERAVEDTEPSRPDDREICSDLPAALVCFPIYHRQSNDFKKRMFRAMLREAEELEKPAAVHLYKVEDLPNRPVNDEQALWEHMLSINKRNSAQPRSNAAARELTSIAFDVALSLLAGVGTAVDEKAAMKWLSIGALCGQINCQLWYPILEASTAQAEQGRWDSSPSLPRRLWCAFGAWHGSASAWKILTDGSPQLRPSMERLLRSRFCSREGVIDLSSRYLAAIGESTKQKASTAVLQAPEQEQQRLDGEAPMHILAATAEVETVSSLLGQIAQGHSVKNRLGETPMFFALRAGRGDVAELLCGHGASVSDISTGDLSPMHCLSMFLLEDEKAAKLASMFVDRGAKLDMAACEPPVKFSLDKALAAGTPLVWAALKSRPLLFSALLNLHAAPDRRISTSDYSMLLRLLGYLNQHEMLAQAIDLRDSIVDEQLEQNATKNPSFKKQVQQLEALYLTKFSCELPVDGNHSGNIYTKALCGALYTSIPMLLRRMFTHTTGHAAAKVQTVKLLLKHGADPAGDETKSLLRTLISHCETDVFRQLLDHLAASAEHEVVEDLLSDSRRYCGYSALVLALLYDAREIFALLLNRYPSLLRWVDEEGNGALQYAAKRSTWPGYAKMLLAKGADPLGAPGATVSPFELAIMFSSNLKVARELARPLAATRRLDVVLGSDSKTGYTLFARMIHALIFTMSDFGVDRLRFLVDNYGQPSFFANQGGKTVFEVLFQSGPVQAEANAVALQHAIFEYLLDLFPDMINFVDGSGKTPLHWATWSCDLRAVEALLRRGADVSAEVVTGKLAGHTALGIAMGLLMSGTPYSIARAGQKELERWRANLVKIAELLIDHGDGVTKSGMSPLRRGHPALALCADARLHASQIETVRGGPDEHWRWSRRVPWESAEELSPFAAPGGPDAFRCSKFVSYVGLDGLTKFVRAGEARNIPALDLRYPKKPEKPADWDQTTDMVLRHLRGARQLIDLRAAQVLYARKRLPPGWLVRLGPDQTLQYWDQINDITTAVFPEIPGSTDDEKKAHRDFLNLQSFEDIFSRT